MLTKSTSGPLKTLYSLEYSNCFSRAGTTVVTMTWNHIKNGGMNWVCKVDVCYGDLELWYHLLVEKRIMQGLHKEHPGITRMKVLARTFVWWLQLDTDIEELVKNCEECQFSRHLPPVAPLHPWEWPQWPWAQLHADYAGPFLDRHFLLLVDAHSKWIEVKPVPNVTTTTTTVEQMCSIFAHTWTFWDVSDRQCFNIY